jgi:O-antigen/teichoic acid export membrane protein
VARVIGFAATVYVARVLGAGYFGAIELAGAIVLYFSRVADGGFDLGLGVREVAANPEQLDRLVSPALTLRSLVSGLLVVLVSLTGFALLPRIEATVLAAYSLTLLAVGMSTRWVHVGIERARVVAVARTIGEIIMVLLIVSFVSDSDDVIRVPLARFAGEILASLLLLAVLIRRGVRLRPRFDWNLIRPLARRALPLVLSALLGLMIFNMDLILLRVFRTSVHVGYYAAAYALISFLANLSLAYGLSLLPALTRLEQESEKRRRVFQTAFAHAFAVGLPVAAGATLLAGPIIQLVFGAEYAEAALPMAIVIWSIPLGTARDINVAALLALGEEGRVLRLTAIAAACNLVLNLLLIPPMGIPGAAIATLITESLRMLLAARFAGVLGFCAPGLSRFWKAAVAAVVMAGAVHWVRPLGLAVAIPVGALTYTLALAALGGVYWQRGSLPKLKV